MTIVSISTGDTLKRVLENTVSRRKSYKSAAPVEHIALQVTITALIVALATRWKKVFHLVVTLDIVALRAITRFLLFKCWLNMLLSVFYNSRVKVRLKIGFVHRGQTYHNTAPL